jgi:predicted esterase
MPRTLALPWLLLVLCCQSRASVDANRAALDGPATVPTPTPSQAAAAKTAAQGPIRMEALDPKASPPTFVMRGGPRGPGRLVFLHGMCGHGLGYAQAFQFSAAARGTLIAPQGDVSCGGVWSKWSADTAALDARIVAAFRALGDDQPITDVVIMGMSQGATRAVALARKYPERYTRLIAMAGPTLVTSSGLSGLRAAVFMAGARDRQDLMRGSERSLAANGIPATFILIPQATHGAMGPTPEKTMAEALSWLADHEKPGKEPS